MMGPGGMHSGMMMRMLFAMMDSDGDSPRTRTRQSRLV
jgi:hypothetical protein